MKKMKTTLGVMVSAAVCVLALAGCSRESMEKETGEVKFGFTSVAATTRTEFENHEGSPEGVTPSGTTKEQVNWVVGDVVTICSDRAVKLDGTTHVSEYEVSSLEGRASNPDGVLASVDNHGTGGGLRWADETNVHKFFAVYGTPASISMDGGVTGATIPANQTLTWNDDNTVGKTPMTYAYMVGLLKTKYETQVVLPMRQMYTAFQFTVSSGDNAEVGLSTFTLSSTSTALAGGFTVAYPGVENPSIDNLAIVPTATAPTTSTPSTITVNFPTGFKVLNGKPVTFTVLALGQELTDLSITFSGKTLGTRTLALNKNSGKQPIVFSPSTKNLINGLSFPNLQEATGEDIIWEQTAIGEDIAWLDDSYVLGVRDPYDLTYKGGRSETGGVISYRIVDGNPVAAAWTVVGYYDTREAAENASSDDTSHRDLPSWIKENGYPSSGAGAASTSGQSVLINYLASTPSSTEKTITAEEINDEIASSTFGLGSSPECYFNLANPENKLSDEIIESANSYIVNGPGYYRIPMVMGNGVKANKLNTQAYTKIDGANADNFVNHADLVVNNPFLQKSNGNYTLSNAYVVWESTNGLIETTGTAYSIPNVSSNSPFTMTAGTGDLAGNDIYWLNFHVAKGEQGNAVIAVTDGTDVLWSYHIWVTNYVCRNEVAHEDILMNLYPNSADFKPYAGKTDKTYNLMPLNLGWLYEGEHILAKKFASNTMYVKILQAGSNKTTVMEVKRPGHHVVTQYGKGNAPYYQWGRKDPFMPTNTQGGGKNHTFTTGAFTGTGVSLGTGIQHPETFYLSDGDGNIPWFKNPPAANLWCADVTKVYNNQTTGGTNQGNDEARNRQVIKSIYDPCPAGYSVPTYGAYSYRTDDNTEGYNVTYSTSTGEWSKPTTSVKYSNAINYGGVTGMYKVSTFVDFIHIYGIRDGYEPDNFWGFNFYTNTDVTYFRPQGYSYDVPQTITLQEPCIFFPASGYRSYGSGNVQLTDTSLPDNAASSIKSAHATYDPNGSSGEVGKRGYYWSALEESSSQGLSFDIEHYWTKDQKDHYFNVKNWSHFPLSDGCSIRPMQNDN